MPRKRIPDDKLERAVPLGHGLGGAEIGDLWQPSVDPEVLNDRLRRRDEQVAKLKQDRSELKVAMRLKTEEAYNEGLLSVAPKLLEIDKAVADLTATLLAAGIDDDNLKVLKTLLPELSKQRDRLYGKTRQRVDTTSLSASVDINLLHEQSRGALPAGPGPDEDPEVLDVEPEDAEMIDE